jgi:hypothetical protein
LSIKVVAIAEKYGLRPWTNQSSWWIATAAYAEGSLLFGVIWKKALFRCWGKVAPSSTSMEIKLSLFILAVVVAVPLIGSESPQKAKAWALTLECATQRSFGHFQSGSLTALIRGHS